MLEPTERVSVSPDTVADASSLKAFDAVSGDDEAPKVPRRGPKKIAPPVAPSDTSKAKRRKFSLAEKQRILRLADECQSDQELAALLRREGIYRVTLQRFVAERSQAKLTSDTARLGTSHGQALAAANRRNTALEREIERLKRKLEKAEIVIDFQKKLSHVLGLDEEEIPPG